ncbi:MAG: ATP-binding protein [Candidatus Eisenbacteria sp.]|nr:ATP-binding protein [Candidatus Eisenbacteria bacterium]
MTSTQLPRIIKPAKGSFFLFGPRGTGKSTWLKTAFPRAHTINLLDEALYQSYLADIGLFVAELRSLRPGTQVVLDEVQRIPQLLNEVHRFMEERRLRFVLCGSSARKLKQSGTNLLAGRAVRHHMHPFVPEELGREFDLDDLLRWGSLPVIWNAEDRRGALEAYVQMYLREEIQAEALVRNLPGFARFLPIAALFHAQTLNAAGLARDAQVARTTVLGYLSVLVDTLVAFTLPAYETKLRVKERKHPKLYWCDPGLVRALRRQFSPPGAEECGALFKGWIAQLLRAYRDYRRLYDDWFYWAPSEAQRTEVDFLLRRGQEMVAIEVKAGKTFAEVDARGLRAIAELQGLTRRILIYRGARRLKTKDGIDVLPVGAFAEELEGGRLFP